MKVVDSSRRIMAGRLKTAGLGDIKGNGAGRARRGPLGAWSRQRETYRTCAIAPSRPGLQPHHYHAHRGNNFTTQQQVILGNVAMGRQDIEMRHTAVAPSPEPRDAPLVRRRAVAGLARADVALLFGVAGRQGL